ncbi:hypothetical protein BKA63DRAFT_519949 [Paraphoma chrysanthemicola]|nr:hypothetical protein BKA63DRAFT_519949 [Paraphoma chrysanthemicola]
MRLSANALWSTTCIEFAMGEQVIFDNGLIRTLQSRSCDQCFLRKSKCSRHVPCQSCNSHRRPCTYERQSQYRRRSHVVGSRRSRPTEISPSAIMIEELWFNHNAAEDDGSPDAILSPDAADRGIVIEAPALDEARTDELVSALGNIGSGIQDWINVGFPAGAHNASGVEFVAGSSPASLEEHFQEPFPNIGSTTWVPLLASAHNDTHQLMRYPFPDTIPRLITLFMEQLHPSMPVFKVSYIIDGIRNQRFLHDRSFSALLHGISALVVFQILQNSSRRRNESFRVEQAESLLAEAVRLHSHADLGESPMLNHVLTSMFLFGCQFCKGNHHAAKLRLREAVTLAETMGLDDPQTYTGISGGEKERRMRTYLCLTVIHRVYALQRECSLNDYLLTSRRLNTVQDMIKKVSISMDAADIRVMKALGHMVGLIEFVDSIFVRCWRSQCWTESNQTHVSSATVITLLQRYTAPIVIEDSSNEAQQADFLITRHWISYVLWALGQRHGYISKQSLVFQMRPDYALIIARDSIETCETVDIASLECHGVGLMEKLYDIVTCAIRTSRSSGCSTEESLSPSFPYQDRGFVESWSPPSEPNGGTAAFEWQQHERPTTSGMSVSEFANRYLAIFARFRGGNHPYLKPYMRLLCELDLP